MIPGSIPAWMINCKILVNECYYLAWIYYLTIWKFQKNPLYIQLNTSNKLAFQMKRQMNTKLTQQVPLLQRLWVPLAFVASRFSRCFWLLQVKQKSWKAKKLRDILPRQDILAKCLVVPLHLPMACTFTSQKENPTFRPTPTNRNQNQNLFSFTCLHVGLDFGTPPSKTEWFFGF